MQNNFKIVMLLFSCMCASAQGQNKMPHASAAPMSCNIDGQVVKIFKAYNNDKKSPCAKHPCRAMVKILRVAGCGQSVTVPMIEGDTVEINFAYTLHSTKRIYPAMKTKYPGLKKGQGFSGRVEQHPKMGGGVSYTIYDYEAGRVY